MSVAVTGLVAQQEVNSVSDEGGDLGDSAPINVVPYRFLTGPALGMFGARMM